MLGPDRAGASIIPPQHHRGRRAGAVRGVKGFTLPVPTPGIAVSAKSHPRMDADPAHRWLRNTVMAVCQNECRSHAMGALTLTVFLVLPRGVLCDRRREKSTNRCR